MGHFFAEHPKFSYIHPESSNESKNKSTPDGLQCEEALIEAFKS